MTDPNAMPNAETFTTAASTPVYEYVLTKRDLLDAQRVFRKRYRSSAAVYWFWFWVIPLVGFVLALLPVYYWLQHDPRMMRASYALAAAGLYFAVVMPLLRLRQMQKIWRNVIPKPLEGKPVSLRFNDEWIASGIPGRSEGLFRWSSIYDFAEDEKIGLILIRKKAFLFIPKPALPPEVWQRLRELAPKEPQKHLF